MIDIKRKKVKAIYFNAFHCPECGLELYKDNITLTTYPAQYCYYCECGFRTTSFQTPGIEYEFEEEDLPSTYPERIVDTFCEIPLSQVYPSPIIANLIAQGEGFADKTAGVSYV